MYSIVSVLSQRAITFVGLVSDPSEPWIRSYLSVLINRLLFWLCFSSVLSSADCVCQLPP